jgi:hypothetical protein
LCGDYSSPGQVTAVISSEFVLVDDLDGAGRIVFNKQYGQAEPAASSDAGALAASWGSALRQIFLQLTNDLQVLLAKQNGTY